MPRNSSGVYSPPVSSFNPATNGNLATAGDFNALLADLSTALTDSLSRGGNGSLTANLNAGSNKITSLAIGTGTGDAVAWQQLFQGGTMADIASAATVDIGVQNTSFLRMTGTTTVTSFGTNFRGPRFITFEGAVTLTHSSTLVLPGGANITTAAGDSLIVIPGATAGTADKWIVVAYQAGKQMFTVSVPTSAWTGTGPHTAVLTVAGISVTDNPIVDIDLSGVAFADVEDVQADWGLVYRVAATANNQLTLFATDEPTENFTINAKVVR